jgi:hypothetical protein
MALKAHTTKRTTKFALGVGACALIATLVIPPALAQMGGPNRRGGVFDFFGPFSGPRFGPPEPRADYSRAPPPRRADIQPGATTVLVLGDSMADWLASGLEDALGDGPEFGIIRRHRTTSGLIRYDARNETQDWAQAAREAITATKPKFIVMMVGLHDRQSIRVRPVGAPGSPPAPATTPAQQPAAPATAAPATPAPASGAQEAEVERPADQSAIIAPEGAGRGSFQTYEFRTDAWAEQYTKRIDATIAALKTGGVPVFWVGLPAIRGPRSTSDMQYLDELFRTRAEKGGITYIDTWDGFVEDGGRFAQQGPDFEGQIRRLRVADGVHFTKAGARKLAHYVERELRRSMTRGVTPVALPTTEPAQQTPVARPGQPAARPLSGPVMPLTAAVGGQQDLAGGTSGTPPSQPVVTRVLQRGEAVPAPAGRADDFTWPRRAIAPFGTDPVVATTTDPIPVMQAAPAATTVPVPNEELRPVAAAAPRRQAPRAPNAQQQAQQQFQQQQQRRANNVFSFPFFR